MTIGEDSRAVKRIRTEDSIESPLNPTVLQRADELALSCKNAKPYAHGVIPDLFQSSFAKKVLEEFKNNMKAKYKESDLFRVYQSIDLGNLDPNHASNHELMPNVMRLREILYSQAYRSFIEKVANIEHNTLIDKVDCALNCHDKGCHLLCHDDVIGTRKVSYIFYLTDPEPDWTDEDGGRLELYESITMKEEEMNGDEINIVEKKVPTCFPTATVLPKFNSLAYFVVEPGVSFHSVQEVFCDRPRLSLQGWYHAKEAPKLMEYATLNQLKCNNSKDMEGEFTPYTDSNDEGDLNSIDIDFLSKFINKTYLKEESIEQIRVIFEEESSVQLRHFFNEDLENKISKLLKDEDSRDKVGGDKAVLDYTTGISEDWIPQGPAHKQRFLQCKFHMSFEIVIFLKAQTHTLNLFYADTGLAKKDGVSLGSILKFLKEEVMESQEFGRLLNHYTSLGFPLGHRGRVRRFRPGLDYTIAHYGILTKAPVLDATVCFVSGKGDQCTGEDDDNDDDIIWQSDNSGGFECYIEADTEEQDKEADDEYDEEDDTKLLSVSASNNTLSLVYRDPGTMRFVKYVNATAPSSRFDVSLEYQVDDIDDEDDDEDNNVGF